MARYFIFASLLIVCVAILLVFTMLATIMLGESTQVISGAAVAEPREVEPPVSTTVAVPDEPEIVEPSTFDTPEPIVTTGGSSIGGLNSGSSAGSASSGSGSSGSSGSGSSGSSSSGSSDVVVVYQDTQDYLEEKFGEEAEALKNIDPNTPVDVGGVTVPAGDIASTLAVLMQNAES